MSFDLRLAEYIEIGGWENHSSVYRISTFDQLPVVVQESYAQKFLGSPLTLFKEENQYRVRILQQIQEERQTPAMSLHEQLQASLVSASQATKIL